MGAAEELGELDASIARRIDEVVAREVEERLAQLGPKGPPSMTIIAMDLPAFQPRALGAGATWHELTATDQLPVGGVMRMDCDGRGVFIYRTEGAFRVYDSRCPHEATNIPHLALDGTTLTCPKHGWVFDIASGACIDKGDAPLNERETKVENERLFAFW